MRGTEIMEFTSNFAEVNILLLKTDEIHTIPFIVQGEP